MTEHLAEKRVAPRLSEHALAILWRETTFNVEPESAFFCCSRDAQRCTRERARERRFCVDARVVKEQASAELLRDRQDRQVLKLGVRKRTFNGILRFLRRLQRHREGE